MDACKKGVKKASAKRSGEGGKMCLSWEEA